jgi:predicted nucleic acid-binding Zn ribbon protein
MSVPVSPLPDRPEAVRTPLQSPVVGSRPCPVCGRAELQGRQTACSAACRRERSRRREQEGRRAREAEILADLDAIERLAKILRQRLEGGA